jgi:hypothetical protein
VASPSSVAGIAFRARTTPTDASPPPGAALAANETLTSPPARPLRSPRPSSAASPAPTWAPLPPPSPLPPPEGGGGGRGASPTGSTSSGGLLDWVPLPSAQALALDPEYARLLAALAAAEE